MKQNLQAETENLKRSWLRHDSGKLRDYLVSGVEDPRINAQSILSRHFLLESCGLREFRPLMDQEHRFGAVMNWLMNLLHYASEPEELASVLHALRRRADNSEGIEIPQFVLHAFRQLPSQICGLEIPNFIQTFLEGAVLVSGGLQPDTISANTFQKLWNTAIERHLEAQPAGAAPAPRPSVIEPACGSANDYRFLHTYGLTSLIDYSGFDLCEKNVANAREFFPEARFECGNAFALPARDKAFELCFVHDLFEHLSLEGMEQAIAEVCRVTRAAMCVGFFNMYERPEHRVVPDEDYFWNDLSLERTRESFARFGFTGQAIHIDSFLRDQVGCPGTHNPNAYTLRLFAAR